jgi:hypothetical protein
MHKLLLQLDSSPHASVFDRVVAYDAGVDHIMSCAGVTEADVAELVQGAIFTRGPKDLHNTAIFIGGRDMAAGERLMAAVRASFVGPFRVSVMLDSNGSNTTAVAAVAKIRQTLDDDLKGRRIVITAGTGPVGMRAAGLLALAGAEVTLTARTAESGRRAVEATRQRFGVDVRALAGVSPAELGSSIDAADALLNAGAAGVCLVPRAVWEGRSGLRVAVDLNAVPPLGIEGIDVVDTGVNRGGTVAFGALGVGGLKMKVHKTCLKRLFDRNDLEFDAEAIADVAHELAMPASAPGSSPAQRS